MIEKGIGELYEIDDGSFKVYSSLNMMSNELHNCSI